MNGDREAILSRIREALREPAPRRHEATKRVPEGGNVTVAFREWLPGVGHTLDEQIALFAKMSAGLRTEFQECADAEAAARAIAELAEQGGWKRVALHNGELCDPVAAALPSTLAQIRTDDGYDKTTLENCDVGLTECESLVAQTGSVCVTTLSSGGRALSALPPHHIVVAKRSQIVADLPAAYERLAQRYGDNYPSFIGFITGPSRTGDIERILVLGAHGPKRLTVLLLP
ncbi:LutC/YkgG family protein [Verrucomicrobiota bacterium sgz303538]